MELGYLDPFDSLLRLQRALERPRPDERFGLSLSGAGAFPPVDVFQRGEYFVVMAELPGLDKSAVSIEVDKNHLRLAGKRSGQPTGGDSSYHRRERPTGTFDRTVTLPIEVDANKTTATYEDGILTVTLPPAADARPRAITVT